MDTARWAPRRAKWGRACAVVLLPGNSAIPPHTLAPLPQITSRSLDLRDVRADLPELEHAVGVPHLRSSRVTIDPAVLAAHVLLNDPRFAQGAPRGRSIRRQACVAEPFTVRVAHSTIQVRSTGRNDHGHEVHLTV